MLTLIQIAQVLLDVFWWIIVIQIILSLLIFIGEAVRDAFDPRKTFK